MKNVSYIYYFLVLMSSDVRAKLYNKLGYDLDALQCAENVVLRWIDKNLASIISDLKLGFYLSILRDDIFRILLERIESN